MTIQCLKLLICFKSKSIACEECASECEDGDFYSTSHLVTLPSVLFTFPYTLPTLPPPFSPRDEGACSRDRLGRGSRMICGNGGDV